MADPCRKILSQNLTPGCVAFEASGGLKKEGYAISASQILGWTYDVTGKFITGFSLEEGAELAKFFGGKLKNSGTVGLTVNDNGTKLINHNFIGQFYYSVQLDKEAIEGLIKADDLVIFVERSDVRLGWEVYGKDNGLEANTLDGGTGVALGDNGASYTVTFGGLESKLPMFAKFGATPVLDKLYLESRSIDYVAPV